MKRSVSHLRGESGAVAVVVALLLIVFIGFAALVVDMGYAYSVKRQLQAAADAAALAGCQELILGGSESEIQAVAREYAEQHNAVRPGDGLVMLDESPDFEVTDTYVKATVEKPMSLFFGRLFTNESGMIRAQAKAQIAYLTGMKNLKPFGLPFIAPENGTVQVSVEIGTGARTILTQSPQDPFLFTYSAVPVAGPANTTQPVRVFIRNGQGFEEELPAKEAFGVARVVVRDSAVLPPDASAMPVVRATITPNTILADSDKWWDDDSLFPDTVRLNVQLASVPDNAPVAYFSNDKKRTMWQNADGTWSADLPVERRKQTDRATDDVSEVLYATVDTQLAGRKYSVDRVAALFIRQSSLPLEEVLVQPTGIDVQGGAQVSSVTVRLHDYTFGYPYSLRPKDGESGNFQIVNFDTLPDGKNAGADNLKDYMNDGYPDVVRIGDILTTQGTTGVGEGQIPDLTGQVITVPLLEKMGEVNGNSAYRVVAFAAFEVLERDGWMYGRFIEYLWPSDDLSDTPPDGLYIMTPRLVSDGIN